MACSVETTYPFDFQFRFADDAKEIDLNWHRIPKILGFDHDLDGIPEPLETRSPLYERLGLKVFPWTWLLAALAVVLSIPWEIYRGGRRDDLTFRESMNRELSSYTWKGWLGAVVMLFVGLPIASSIVAYVFAMAFGWAAVGLMYFF